MAGKVNVPISVAVQGIAKTQAQLGQLSQGVSNVGRTAGIAAVAFAAFAAGIKSADFAVSAIAGARDLERNLAGLSTVFDEQTTRMKQFATDAQQMGLSLVEASKSATFIGSVLKQSGFSINETADLTERLVGLATDLSITYGYDVQEALLGMTALFRGEYDPIEKFGVAMKQNEINAELAARGLDKLEGAERRLAEQQVRVQFLFERSADAAGALERQSGTLAVEQLRLQASFANMRDTVARTLLPVIADMMKGLGEVVDVVGPELRTAFFRAGPVIKEFAREAIPLVKDLAVALIDGLVALIDFLKYIQDNWDWISVLGTTAGTAAVSIGLMTTAINTANAAQLVLNATVAKNPYVLAATALIALAGGMQAVTSQVQETDPYLEELHNRANSFANDLDKSMSPGLYAAAAETERFGKYMDFLRGRILEVQKTYTNTTTLSGILSASGLEMTDFAPPVPETSPDAGQQARDYVQEYFDALAMEVEKQSARVALEEMGASAKLIESILSSVAWEDIFNLIVEGGVPKLQELQDQFNKTAAGIEELANIEISGAPVATALEGLFGEIGLEVEKQQALLQLRAMGASEGLIGAILGSADWQSIIEDLVAGGEAELTALQGLFNQTAEGLAEIDQLAQDAAELSRDYAAEFLDGLNSEIDKERARRELSGMGATEGLVAAILGSADWEQLYQDIIEGGVDQLAILQSAFNKTADGIAEVNKIIDDAVAAQAALEQQAKDAAEALAQQQQELDDLIAKLADFRSSLSGIVLGATLETFARDVGKFESAIIQSFDNIQQSLMSALENGQIFDAAFQQLMRFANQERAALEGIARQRDELANKADFVESLIRDYRNAFTASLGLTNILQGIEQKTRDITITEVTEGTASVGDALKDLRFTLTRSYTETITETINKSEALVNKFREMAEKSRTFAQNLETLRKLGLDPQLFSQLVQAGVEAGGETAQALVDGGSDTIKEINSLFNEIGATGVDVAESVAEDFYLIGENFGSELLDGIRSQQMEFENTARAMAQAFETAFQVDLGKATSQVSQAAQWQQQIDNLTSQLEFAQKRLGEEQAKLATGTLGPNAREWANKKITSYTAQIATFEAQISALQKMIDDVKVTPFANGGIALGQVLATVGEAGPEAVIPLDRLDALMGNDTRQTGNVYNIYVTADTRIGGAKAGEAIVQQLRQYEDKNGSIGSVLKVN